MHWRDWSNRAVCWSIPHAVLILRKTMTRSGHFSVNILILNWNVPNCFCPLRIAMVHTPRISGRKIDPPLCFSFIEKEQSRICGSHRYGFTDKCFYKKTEWITDPWFPAIFSSGVCVLRGWDGRHLPASNSWEQVFLLRRKVPVRQ